MPQSNRRLPKIDHAGRPVTRPYRALGEPLASPIPYRPEPPSAPRLAGGPFSDVVTGILTDYKYRQNAEHR